MFLNRTRQIIGLDIGSHAIKMIALCPAKGELPFELVHFGVAELPEETIVDGAIVDEEAVTRAITELFAQHKVKSHFVAASVSGNAVIVRRVTLPRQDADALRATLAYEAEDHGPRHGSCHSAVEPDRLLDQLTRQRTTPSIFRG